MTISWWHLKAFLNYIKAPREKRAILAAELNDRVHDSIQLI